MKTFTRVAAIAFIIGFYSGCSPVKFVLDDSVCKDNGCIVSDGKYVFNYSATAGAGKVDILIVNDNSASMSFEQARLAPRFRSFISELDGQHVDYRIAMTTTDVSESKAGQLISFQDGVSYLKSSNPDRQVLFNQTIQRPETLSCEKFISDWVRSHGGDRNSINTPEYSTAYLQNCPSGDERGVYAANVVVNKNPANFIRSDAHLAVIFLSDEDERSALYNSAEFKLDQLDQPANLISNVKTKLGEDKYNSLSLHAIVVKDQACLNVQNNQMLDANAATKGLISGSMGNVYLTMTAQGWGNAADICSEDYTSQLGQIRTKISESIKDILLNCSSPLELSVEVNGKSVAYQMEGKVLKLAQALVVGTTINLAYKCTSLN